MYPNRTSEGIAYLNKQSKKFQKLDNAIKNYIRNLCLYLGVDYDEVLIENRNANINITPENFPLQNLMSIANNNCSSTPESLSELSVVIIKLEHAIFKLNKFVPYIINKTELVDNNLKPYITSLFTHPYVFFVYNKDNQIFKWNSFTNILPEKFNLRETFNIRSTSHENYFTESLLILLQEFQKVIVNYRNIIVDYTLELSVTYSTFCKNITRKTEKTTSKSTLQRQNGQNILIKFRYKAEDPILFQLNLISEIIPGLSEYNINFTCDKSNQFFGRILSNLSFLSFKEKIFRICDKEDYYRIICRLYSLQSMFVVANENLYIQTENNILLLNDFIFYIIKTEYSELINKDTLNATLKDAYNCIYGEFRDVFNEIKNNAPILDNNSLENKYRDTYYGIVKELLYTSLPQKLTPSSDISSLINFLTNKDFYILENLIRIIKSIFSDKNYNRLGYLFYNCPKEIFSIYKLFFNKLNQYQIAEIESTSSLNNAKTIMWLLNNQLCNAKPIYVNKVTNMNKNTTRKNLRNILSGKKYKVKLDGNLNNNGFEYRTFIYENNTPILIYAENDGEAKRILNDFNEYIYKLDFKNKEIFSKDCEKYEKIIKNLNALEINLLIYNILSLDLSSKECITNEPLLTDDEFIQSFIDNACKIDNETYCTTDALFKAFQSYSYNKHNKQINDNYKSTFSKKFKSVANVEKKDTNKAKGYKGVRIIYEFDSLNKQELDIINAESADKKEYKSKYMKTLDVITEFDIAKFLE